MCVERWRPTTKNVLITLTDSIRDRQWPDLFVIRALHSSTFYACLCGEILFINQSFVGRNKSQPVSAAAAACDRHWEVKRRKKNTDTEAESKVQVSVAEGNKFVCEPVQVLSWRRSKNKKNRLRTLTGLTGLFSIIGIFFFREKSFLEKTCFTFLFLKFGPIPNPKLLEHKYTFYPSTQHMIAYVMHLVHVIEGKQLR